MSTIKLILALHDHQPVGNFDGVFEAAYQEGYRPFLDVMDDYPEIPFAIHHSGPLLEWLEEHHPDYIDRLRKMAQAGRVEILGGAWMEPILPMLPLRDRLGQIRKYSEILSSTFGQPIRGMWLAERVWEPDLVSALAEAGIEYTLLDDFHFARAGLEGKDLQGYYLTEDQGKLLKVFPIDEKLRYIIPFNEPHASYERLRELAERRPGSVVVFGDDGEKFGAWPETHEHVYRRGWLRRFCDMLMANRDWVEVITPSRALDTTVPLGKIYLPQCSYREMTEWVLPAERQARYLAAVEEAEKWPGYPQIRPFVAAAGFWRNFRVKYPEADEMATRMLAVSSRLERLSARTDVDPDYLDIARDELYRGQCNCPYWHGAFGGLYLPHLRNAIYRHLIGADKALDEAEGIAGPFARAEIGDLNLDARQEVRLENDELIALIRPACGGHIYELDVKRTQTNVLATLDRRREPYHAKVAAAARATAVANEANPDEVNNLHNRVILKQEGLDRLLTYDSYPRKALVDHFYPIDVGLEDLILGTQIELGDFVSGTYLSRVQRTDGGVALIMERPGRADTFPIRIRKSLALEAGSDTLEVRYELEDLPPGFDLCFAVEINLAAMAGQADDRNFIDESGRKLGPLNSRLDLPECGKLSLRDDWQDLAMTLEWSRPGEVFCYPIATVSQSEGGFESVFQSAAVVPHWRVQPGADRRWEVTITIAAKPIAEVPVREDTAASHREPAAGRA